MGDYPDEDEEYELMYGDDLDAMRDNEEMYNEPNHQAKRSLDFSSPAIKKVLGPSFNEKVPKTPDLNSTLGELEPFPATQEEVLNESGIEDLPSSQKSLCNQGNGQSTQKRTVEDLFGDIDDIMMYDEEELTSRAKRFKDELECDQMLIDKILAERRKKWQLNHQTNIIGKDFRDVNAEQLINNVSKLRPRWPCITLTQSHGEKLFIRLHNEEYMEREIDEVSSIANAEENLMGNTFRKIWEEAKAALEKKQQKETQILNSEMSDIEMLDQELQNSDSTQLWVDRYKPMSYMELLSDESTNRTLLQWLKLWDKIVFKRDIKIKKNTVSSSFNKRSGKFEFGMKKFKTGINNISEMPMELDEQGRPEFKVALLCGPPGCGKTTLAHMIAKHSGYLVREINASDDRNVDAFKTALENATEMDSVLHSEKKPKCLILDEIDGAPLPTIEYLVKFINGTINPKAKKGVKVKPKLCRRPIICICNDPYAPSLRPLRQIALVVHFPPTQVGRLAQRLIEIAGCEGLKTDLSTLTALGEKTSNDIRSCLGILHFLKAKRKLISLSDIQKASIGVKDMSKGLFQVWQEIFQIQLPKHKKVKSSLENSFIESDIGDKENTLRGRAKKVLNTVYSAGDYDKLMQGVYENFLSMKMKDSTLLGVCTALDWFEFYDLFNSYIGSTQNFSLMPYLPHAFVSWHFLFAGIHWPKLKFPNQGFEMYQKQTQLLGIVSSVDSGMCPKVKATSTKNILILDTIPMLPHIVTPGLRPVNIQLYSEREKRDLASVVGVMIDYNIQYTQERSQDGTYCYVLDPDINRFAIFDEKKCGVRNLTYATKQLISREVELEKINRLEMRTSGEVIVKKTKPVEPKKIENQSPKAAPVIPNHLQRLQPKSMIVESNLITKDFFGRKVICSPATAAKRAGKTDEIVKSPVWYHYKEGFNNAVRRDVKISDLM